MMLRLIKIHIVFLLIAIFIAYVLVPADWYYFEKVSAEDIKQYYQNTFSFSKKSSPWKILITWFIGLSCGRLIIKALRK